jgi:ADP-heptose:LPS heptosyltransferase
MSSVQAWLAERGWRIREAVHVHPGSGGLSKVWPLGRWWALLRWLRFQAGLPVLMSLGPADQQLRDFAVKAQQALEIPVIEGVALTRLAAFLSSARFYIGNDSGVTHLAAAMGIPVVAVFGPTPPEVWAPQGPHVHVIRSRWRKQDILEWHPSERNDPEKPVQALLERLTSQ